MPENAKESFKTLWIDFRNGHGVYLSFLLAFSNFILIAYNFFVTKVEFFSGLNLVYFVLLFISIYVPAALFFGRTHRKSQWKKEHELMWEESTTNAWIWRVTCEFMEKVLDKLPSDTESIKLKNEVRDLKRFLEKIEDRHKVKEEHS